MCLDCANPKTGGQKVDTRRMMMMAAGVGAVSLLAASAHASVLTMNVSGDITGNIWNDAQEGVQGPPPGIETPNGTPVVRGNYYEAAPFDFISYGVAWASGANDGFNPGGFGDDSAFVLLNLSFENTTGVDQVFEFNASTDVDPDIVGPTLIDGSISGSVTDADGDGSATAASPAGESLYNSLVDGNNVRTLYDDNTWDVNQTSGTTNIDLAFFGFDPSEAGPNDAADIALNFRVFLTAGDSISLSGFFAITADPIPAPGAFALLGLAGLAGTRRRRG